LAERRAIVRRVHRMVEGRFWCEEIEGEYLHTCHVVSVTCRDMNDICCVVATWSSAGLVVVREIPAVASLNRRRRMRGREESSMGRCMAAILIHRACRR